MNDRELQMRVRDAFDGAPVPDEVRRRTLDAIDGMRGAGAADGPEQPSAGTCATPARIAPFPRKRRRNRILGRSLGAIAACVAVICALFGLNTLNATPTAFVDIDVNPSIELQINRYNKVVGAEAYNDDGRSVLDRVSLDGLDYRQALDALTAEDALGSYLDSDAYVQFSVVSDDKGQEESLTLASEECLASLPGAGACAAVSPEVHAQAQANGMGCGRYAMALELTELDPETTLDECEGLSMRELRDRVESCRNGHGSADAAQQGGNGAGQGQGWGTGQGAGHGAGHGHGAHHGTA